MVSMPGMPSVKHTAELWFDEPKCEARRIDIENVLYNTFTSPVTKPIVEASGHIYEGTSITRWLSE